MKGERAQAGRRCGDQTHQRVLGDTSSLSRALSFCCEWLRQKAELQTDEFIQHRNLTSTVNAKLNGMLTQDIPFFTVSKEERNMKAEEMIIVKQSAWGYEIIHQLLD